MTPEELLPLKRAWHALKASEVGLIGAISRDHLDTALLAVRAALTLAQAIDNSVQVTTGDRQTARVELRYALHCVEAKLGNHVWKLRKSFR